jgi:hypothetical protein
MALIPPMVKAVAKPRFVPVMLTKVPTEPEEGENEVMVGFAPALKVNPPRLPVPPGLVIETDPEVPAPTIAVMVVLLMILNEAAAEPPKFTEVAVEKLLPVMVTLVPDPAEVGVKEVMVGAGTKVNPAKPAVPPLVVTETTPVAPPATTA